MGRESGGGVNPYFCERPYVLNLKSKSIYINIYRAFAGVGDNPPIWNLYNCRNRNAITFQTHTRK